MDSLSNAPGTAAEDWVFVSAKDTESPAAPIVYTTFDVAELPLKGTLDVTALGLYEVRINGRLISTDVLQPGWTEYRHRVGSSTYDITHLLQQGENRIEILIGNGWYGSPLTWLRERMYGERIGAAARLTLIRGDGRSSMIATGPHWLSEPSGILANDLYDGQMTDLGWVSAGEGEPVDVILGPPVVFHDEGPPVGPTERLRAVTLFSDGAGGVIADFGQNLAGWVVLTVRNTEPGQRIVVRHAEMLDHGSLETRTLRGARAEDVYLCRGGESETLSPSLTFHGFRYAQIAGAGDLQLGDIEAEVVGSTMERIGWFECSDPLLNRLHENVVWSMRSNFISIPTDCPQRDERLGWTADIQVFGPTASFLYDVRTFLARWLTDLRISQGDNGSIPLVIPDVLRDAQPVSAGWGDVATVLPWTLYERFGDIDILRTHLDSMTRWVDCVAAVAGEELIWDAGFQFGDWVDPTSPPDYPELNQADPAVVATAHLAHSAQIVADAASVLGDPRAAHYGQLAERVRTAFRSAFVTPDGRIQSDCQTVYAIAICWDLLEPSQRKGAGERLVRLVRRSGYRIATGFLGTPLVLDALTASGRPDIAFRLLTQTECPSWLYPVTQGATTIWERWDSLMPSGEINPGEMTSFNHYALGAVADWMHRELGGITPTAPGYATFRVSIPTYSPLTRATTRRNTDKGPIIVAWTRSDNVIQVKVTVPRGIRGTVPTPDGSEREIGEGTHRFVLAEPGGIDADPDSWPVRALRRDQETWNYILDELVAFGAFDSPAGAEAALDGYSHLECTDLVRQLRQDDPVHVTNQLAWRLIGRIDNSRTNTWV